MLNWRNTAESNGIRIHGTKDKILPIKRKMNYEISNAGHFMIVNRANEIGEILEKES